MSWGLWQTLSPLPSFYGIDFKFQNGQHVERVNIIKSSIGMRHGDPLRGLLFVLAHYQAFLETIMWAPIYVFPSSVDDTHIVGHSSDIFPI